MLSCFGSFSAAGSASSASIISRASKEGGHHDNALQDSALEREVQRLRDALAAMREDRDAARVDRDAWRDLARKEGDERRELAQRFALAAPIAAPEPVAAAELEPRRSWVRWWFRWRAA